MVHPRLTLDTPALARHYEEVSVERQFRVGRLLLKELRIDPGDRVLDVGCGTGRLTEYAAMLSGPQGQVLGIDPLATRIELARRRSHATLRFEVGKACRLEHLPEGGFDAVVLHAVLHWLPEKFRPLRQIYRVLRPGGRLGIWTGSKRHPMRSLEIRRRVLESAPFADTGAAQQGDLHRVDAEELAQLLQDTGFTLRTVQLHAGSFVHPSADSAIADLEAGTFGNFLGHLPPALKTLARERIHAELERHRTPQGIPEDGAQLLAIAVK